MDGHPDSLRQKRVDIYFRIEFFATPILRDSSSHLFGRPASVVLPEELPGARHRQSGPPAEVVAKVSILRPDGLSADLCEE